MSFRLYSVEDILVYILIVSLSWIFFHDPYKHTNVLIATLVCMRSLSKITIKMKDSQSCPTLCNPMAYTVHGIIQARLLEWVAAPFSRGFSQPRDRTQVSRIAGRVFTR